MIFFIYYMRIYTILGLTPSVQLQYYQAHHTNPKVVKFDYTQSSIILISYLRNGLVVQWIKHVTPVMGFVSNPCQSPKYFDVWPLSPSKCFIIHYTLWVHLLIKQKYLSLRGERNRYFGGLPQLKAIRNLFIQFSFSSLT